METFLGYFLLTLSLIFTASFIFDYRRKKHYEDHQRRKRNKKNMWFDWQAKEWRGDLEPNKQRVPKGIIVEIPPGAPGDADKVGRGGRRGKIYYFPREDECHKN